MEQFDAKANRYILQQENITARKDIEDRKTMLRGPGKEIERVMTRLNLMTSGIEIIRRTGEDIVITPCIRILLR